MGTIAFGHQQFRIWIRYITKHATDFRGSLREPAGDITDRGAISDSLS
jgi:hypothetical protein